MPGLNFKIYSQRVKFWLCSCNGTAINRRMPKYTHINSSRVVFIWSKNESLTSTIISSNTAAIASVPNSSTFISPKFYPVHVCSVYKSNSACAPSVFPLYNLTVGTKILGPVVCSFTWHVGLNEIKQGRLRLRAPWTEESAAAWISLPPFLLNWCKGWLSFSGKGEQWSQINKIYHSNSLTYPENHNGE